MLTDGVQGVKGEFELIVSNPPSLRALTNHPRVPRGCLLCNVKPGMDTSGLESIPRA